MNTVSFREQPLRAPRPIAARAGAVCLWRFGCVILSLALAGCRPALSAAPTASAITSTVTPTTGTPAATFVATRSLAATPIITTAATPTRPPTPTVLPSPTAEAWESGTLAAIDTVAQNLMGSVPLAGLTVAVRQGTHPVYVQGYGWANMQAHVQAQPDTVYEIASLSKQFTAAAILQLAEQGKLQLEAPAARYLPDLPAVAQAITVRQLLHHTSGLPKNDFLYVVLNQPESYTPGAVLAAYEQSLKSLSFDPGTSWEYSNMGYFMLGAIIENVSGQTYGDYMEQHVFGPAGLAATSYCLQPPADLAQSYAVGGPNWVLVKSENLSLNFAAGGLCSTARDLIAWQQALTDGRVVSPESYRAMISPVTLLTGTPVPYGYGLRIGDYGGQPAAYHQGMVTGYSSVLAYYPGDDTAIVLLTNTQAQIELLDAAVGRIRGILSSQP